MSQSTRRVTAGFNSQGQSVILADEQSEMFAPYAQFPSFQLSNLFYTDENPQSLSTRHNNAPYGIDLPTGAMRFLKVRMATKHELIADMKNANMPIPEDWKTFNLHTTDSVDYLYILSGKVTCVVGTQELELKAGDFLTQVGAEHTWINDHDEPCYMLCVMVGIKPSGERKKMSAVE